MSSGDRERTGTEIEAILKKIGREACFLTWNHQPEPGAAPVKRCCVIAQTDSADAWTTKIGTSELSRREPWQRDNIVLAIGTDVDRVLWEAQRETMVPLNLTLWFDRVRSQYHLGPRCARTGKSGRPIWADKACAGGRPYWVG